MATRADFQHVVAWCDGDSPFGWLKNVAGVALAVHSVVPIGTPSPNATALWTGDLSLRETGGISRLPDEPVHFSGALEGVRNPARRAQLSLRADVSRATAELSGDLIPAALASRLEIEHVKTESGLLQADWTLGDRDEPPEGFEFPQVFELLVWPALRKNIDLGLP